MRKISLFLVGVFLLLLSGNLFAQEVGEVGYTFTASHAGQPAFKYKITTAADVNGNGGTVLLN